MVTFDTLVATGPKLKIVVGASKSGKYFYEEISHPEAGSPRNTALVHRLQVLQGGERRRGRELFDGGLSWRSNKQTGADVTTSLHLN